ncbi:MAG: ABC transporter ATP-binding protein [Dehalococcoidia bacterium]|nr:ABC transporter ATP-binding protein [Dehalococcoidia bacterium]
MPTPPPSSPAGNATAQRHPSHGAPPLLQVENLQTHISVAGGVVKPVDGVSFHIKQAETVALVGESGSGKSMTALSILRVLPRPGGHIAGGKILFDGVDLAQLSEKEMRSYRGSKIAMILQDPHSSLDPMYQIGEQIGESLRVHHKASGAGVKRRVAELLRLVRIPAAEERARAYPHQMSGGMRQRVVGAIAMSSEPQLIIADEPTTALDVTIQAQYLSLLKDIQANSNLAILLITHDLGIVAKMCQRIIVMYGGRIVEEATVEQAFNRPAHPYTAGLVRSLPKLKGRVPRLYSIEGQPPALDTLPQGCRFAPRCPSVMDTCTKEYPPIVTLQDNQKVACWLHVHDTTKQPAA